MSTARTWAGGWLTPGAGGCRWSVRARWSRSGCLGRAAGMGWCIVACGSPLAAAPSAAFRILDLRPTSPRVGVPAPVSRLPRSGWSPSGEPGGRCSAKRVIGVGTCALAIAIDAGSPTTCCSARAWAVGSACVRSCGSASREGRRVRPGGDMEMCAAAARA